MKASTRSFSNRCSPITRTTFLTILFVQVHFTLFHSSCCWAAAAFSPNRQSNSRGNVSSNNYFQVSFSKCTNLYVPRVYRTPSKLKNSKEDEIAALEERLRKLKEESTVDRYVDINRNPIGREGSEPSLPTKVEPLEEMLSESWKDNEPSDQSGVIRNFVAAFLLVLAAIFFSQIPVGQEGLDKYSTAKPSTTIDLG